MRKCWFSSVFFLTLIISVVFLVVPGQKSPSAAPNYQERFVSPSIDPKVATEETYRVTLELRNLSGITPTKAHWYQKSDGKEISFACVYPATPRMSYYDINTGLLSVTEDYFYVEGCDREPGDYYVTFSWYSYNFRMDFSIEGGAVEPETVFLPLILR